MARQDVKEHESGSRYAAQLAIPLGLGYPLAKCELLGDTPTWLTLDCAALQLKGKVLAPKKLAEANEILRTIKSLPK